MRSEVGNPRTVSLEGFQVAFDDMGAGDNVILFVHGHPFNRSMWGPQLDFCRSIGWRAIAADLRGYGDSSLGQGPTTLEAFAHDQIRLLDRLGLDKVVVAGLSMGGQIAMELCRTHPQYLRGVVFAATFPQAETLEGKSSRYVTADRIEAEGMNAYAEELLPRMLAPRTLDEASQTCAFVLSMMKRTPAAGAASALRGRAERVDYRPTLFGLQLPALIIAGSKDAFTSLAEVEQMQRLMPYAELCWMEDVGHMPNLEAEQAFNSALATFLSKLSSG